MATEGERSGVEQGKAGGEAISTTSFTSLVVMLSSSAWMGLGKIADPVSGEVKKDLEGARYSIEVLGMLREKTKGNLNREEERLLNGLIADLQANYAEAVFSESGASGGGQSSGKAP
jgi:hypothetical protein